MPWFMKLESGLICDLMMIRGKPDQKTNSVLLIFFMDELTLLSYIIPISACWQLGYSLAAYNLLYKT